MSSSTSQDSITDYDGSNSAEGVTMLELVDVLAENEPELAPPLQDEDPDFFFDAEMARSFGDALYGQAIAKRRRENVRKQMEKIKDAQYIEKAKKVYSVIYAQLLKDLKAADELHGIKTDLLTQTDYTVLIAPLLCRLGYPPSNTDGTRGWDDTNIATIRLLHRMLILEARKSGHVALVDVHPCGAHSAAKGDDTFPMPIDNQIDWKGCGCSAEHQAAFVRHNDSIEEWRILNCYGETLNSGFSIAKIWHDEFLSQNQVVRVTVPRVFYPPPKFAEHAVPDRHEANLHYTTGLLDRSFSEEEAKEEVSNSVATFSYYSHSTYHLSYGFYSERSTSCSVVSRILALERAFGEVRYLASLTLDPADEWIVTRSYVARCLGGAKNYSVPLEVHWCYRQLDAGVDVRFWSIETVEEKGGSWIRKKVEEYAEIWKGSGRTSIGKTVGVSGLLEAAIAGWKVKELRFYDSLAYPALPSSTRSIILSIPAATSDGRFPQVPQMQFAYATQAEVPYPLLARSRKSHPLSAPATTSDGRPATVSQVDSTRSLPYMAYPSTIHTAILLAPAATGDGRFCSVSGHNSLSGRRKDGILTLERCLDNDDDLEDCTSLERIRFAKAMDWQVSQEMSKDKKVFSENLHFWAQNPDKAPKRDKRLQGGNRQGLSMQRLLDDDDDLADVSRNEIYAFARTQNWSIPRAIRNTGPKVLKLFREFAKGKPAKKQKVTGKEPVSVARFLRNGQGVEQSSVAKLKQFRSTHQLVQPRTAMPQLEQVTYTREKLFNRFQSDVKKLLAALNNFGNSPASPHIHDSLLSAIEDQDWLTDALTTDEAQRVLHDPAFEEALHDAEFAQFLSSGELDDAFEEIAANGTLKNFEFSGDIETGVEFLNRLFQGLLLAGL